MAIKILDAFIAEYESEEKFRELEGELLSQLQTEEFMNNYIKELNM